MKWSEFSHYIPVNNYTHVNSSRDSIFRLVSHRGQVNVVPDNSHNWYPKGILNADKFRDHRYVDMHHSYYGEDAILVSEANCCVILLLIDSHTNIKFAAHIAACSELKSKYWLAMEFDLKCFFKQVKYDLKRIECYCFSNQLYKDCSGSFEQKNVMKLLSSSLTQDQLEKIAKNTRLIEGENGILWNHHCVVRVSNQAKQSLDISFIH